MLEIPKIIFVMREFGERLPFLFKYSIGIIGMYIYVCEKRIPDNQAISMISSLLYFSMKYLKSEPFFNFPPDNKVEFYRILCLIYDNVILKIALPNKYSDLIRSCFDKSGWTELLIRIFNALNVFSSSPYSDSDVLPSLSFFSSVSPSEYTASILYLTSRMIRILLKSNTPKAVVEYLKLTSFV
jgi:hypothetical protein